MRKKQKRQFCEVWHEGRGSSVWEVTPAKLRVWSLKWCFLSVLFVWLLCWALGTQWQLGWRSSQHPSSPYPWRDRVWGSGHPENCVPGLGRVELASAKVFQLQSCCLPAVLEPLSCCGFAFIFTFFHDWNLDFCCEVPLFLILGSCVGPASFWTENHSLRRRVQFHLLSPARFLPWASEWVSGLSLKDAFSGQILLLKSSQDLLGPLPKMASLLQTKLGVN